jgi:hypothetical protein
MKMLVDVGVPLAGMMVLVFLVLVVWFRSRGDTDRFTRFDLFCTVLVLAIVGVGLYLSTLWWDDRHRTEKERSEAVQRGELPPMTEQEKERRRREIQDNYEWEKGEVRRRHKLSEQEADDAYQFLVNSPPGAVRDSLSPFDMDMLRLMLRYDYSREIALKVAGWWKLDPETLEPLQKEMSR